MSKKLTEKKALLDCLQFVFSDMKWSMDRAIDDRDTAIAQEYDADTVAYRKALVEAYEKVVKTLEGLI